MKHQSEVLKDSSNKLVSLNGLKKKKNKHGETDEKEEFEGAMTYEFDEEELEETRCGIGPFKPRWLQYLAIKETYMLAYSIIGVAQGMFFTYTVSVISTLEKRFKLSSKQTGLILSGNDISQVILSMVLSYYGNYGHRPHWMGLGVMMSGFSCFLAALPHFIYGPGLEALSVVQKTAVAPNGTIIQLDQHFTSTVSPIFQRFGPKKEELCVLGTGLDDHDNCYNPDQQGYSYYGPVILLFISQFMVGIAVSIFYTLGITYLDDNINKKKMSLYYAISMMIRILGPVFGFFLGSKCLSLWIDPNYKPDLSRRDPRWFGAWWVGFVFLCVLLVSIASILFCFPRKLPATLRRERKKAERQAAQDAKEGGDKGVDYFLYLAKTRRSEAKPTMPNLRKALKRLFTNKIWVGNLFNTVVFLLALSGYWNFKPKYLENQFRKSASEANFYTGMASLVASLIGTGLSGIIMRWIRPGPRFVTGYNIVITLVGCLSYVVLMFIGCPKLDVIGPMDGTIGPACSAGCGCTDKFSPICSEDQKTLFYSPCYAGCSVGNSSRSVIFSECRCINSGANSSVNFNLLPEIGIGGDMPEYSTPLPPSNWGTATKGYCPEPCTTFKWYIIIQIITKAIYSTGRVSSSIVHLRSVADEDKGLALGTVTVFISLFAFIPAPIIMGAIVDSACLIWDKTCDVIGNCWLYDSDRFRIILHMVPAVLVFISVFGDIVVYYYSRQLDLYGDKDDEIELEKARQDSAETKPMDPKNAIELKTNKPQEAEEV